MLRSIPSVHGLPAFLGTLDDVAAAVHTTIRDHPLLQALSASEHLQLPAIISTGLTHTQLSSPFKHYFTQFTFCMEWHDAMILAVYIVQGKEYYPKRTYTNSRLLADNTIYRIVEDPAAVIVQPKPVSDCLLNHKACIRVGTKFTYRGLYYPTISRAGTVQYGTYQSSNWQVQEIVDRGVVVEHPGGGHRHLLDWTREMEDIQFLA
jgi:hypothetical protein